MNLVDSSKESSLILDAVVVDQTDTIHKPYHELVSLVVYLHGCNVIVGLLPVYHFPLLHIPNPYHFVETTRDHVVLRVGLHKQGRAKDVRMLQYLNWLVEVDVPNYYQAVGRN